MPAACSQPARRTQLFSTLAQCLPRPTRTTNAHVANAIHSAALTVQGWGRGDATRRLPQHALVFALTSARLRARAARRSLVQQLAARLRLAAALSLYRTSHGQRFLGPCRRRLCSTHRLPPPVLGSSGAFASPPRALSRGGASLVSHRPRAVHSTHDSSAPTPSCSLSVLERTCPRSDSHSSTSSRPA